MRSGKPESARYIQAPIDSRNSAIQHAYHTLLHPSSSSQPRHPLLKIVDTHVDVATPGRHQHSTRVGPNRKREGKAQQHLGASRLGSLPPPEPGTQREIRARARRLTQRAHLPSQQQSTRAWSDCVQMILPQVHLRKPCYDFSFL